MKKQFCTGSALFPPSYLQERYSISRYGTSTHTEVRWYLEWLRDPYDPGVTLSHVQLWPLYNVSPCDAQTLFHMCPVMWKYWDVLYKMITSHLLLSFSMLKAFLPFSLCADCLPSHITTNWTLQQNIVIILITSTNLKHYSWILPSFLLLWMKLPSQTRHHSPTQGFHPCKFFFSPHLPWFLPSWHRCSSVYLISSPRFSRAFHPECHPLFLFNKLFERAIFSFWIQISPFCSLQIHFHLVLLKLLHRNCLSRS